MLRRLLQAELIYFAATKIRIGRGNVAATTSQAGHSFLRHDGAAAILDFKPRIGNHCSQKVKARTIRASILDFKPKLANRCSKKVKTGTILALILDFKTRLSNRCSTTYHFGDFRAAILDFRPRLANRCSQKVKTGAIRASILNFKPRIGNHCSKEGINGQNPAAHLQHAFHHALTMRLAIDSLHRHRFDSGGKSGG